MVEKDFKVLLDVSGCLHDVGTYLHLHIPVWVIPWVVEEHDRPGWKEVSVFDYFFICIFYLSSVWWKDLRSLSSYGRKASCSHSQAQLILGTQLCSHGFIGVTIEVSKAKRGAQSCVFSNWLLRPLDCLCSQHSGNTSLHHFDHRHQIQGKIKGRSARCLELMKVNLLSSYKEHWDSSYLWWVSHFSRGAYTGKYKQYEQISSAGLSVREYSSVSRDLWQGLFIWLYFYSTSLHYWAWTQDTCIVKLASLGEF